MKFSIIRMLLLIAKAFSLLRFSPIDYLEFINSPILIPGQRQFTITNNYDREISVFSVSSDSSNFHATTFEPTLLQPSESLDIEMIFLPYYLEVVHSMLTINTSEGQILYSITGEPVPNPYKLHPFLGQRLHVGSKPREQPITIYNPYSETIFIQEVFTTESFLSLKSASSSKSEHGQAGTNISIAIQPNGSSAILGSSTTVWSVDPGIEKEIIIFTMTPVRTGIFLGYVHIKTNKDDIVLPVELQVRNLILHIFFINIYPSLFLLLYIKDSSSNVDVIQYLSHFLMYLLEVIISYHELYFTDRFYRRLRRRNPEIFLLILVF